MKVAQSCPTLCVPMGYTVHGILQGRILEWVAFLFSRGSSQPRIEPRSPALQVDSLPAEPQGKPKNTGVGSLSLLQQILPTQKLNLGLLNCRQILYQLRSQLCEFHLNWKRNKGGFSGGPAVKNLPCKARDAGLIPGSGRSTWQRSNQAHVTRLLSLRPRARSATWEFTAVRSPPTATLHNPRQPVQSNKDLAKK